MSHVPHLAALALLITAGCASAGLHGTAPVPHPLPADLAAYYSYPSPPQDVTIHRLAARSGFTESLVRFPFSAPADLTPTEPVVEFEWFESTRPGKRPAVIFNPILGGDYPIERNVCRYLAGRGFSVALVHRKTLKISPEHDIARLEILLRQGVIRIRQVVDWMAVQERVDASRMGSFGISMGGIAGVMTAAVEPRLRAHVVALAGGGIADVLAGSHDRLLAEPRRQYLERRGITREELDRRLREVIRTDPVLLAPYVDRRNVLMVIGLADRTIGAGNALRLWRALGRPRAVFLPLGHYTAYLSLPYLRAAGARFLQDRLTVSAPLAADAPDQAH